MFAAEDAIGAITMADFALLTDATDAQVLRADGGSGAPDRQCQMQGGQFVE